MNKTEKFILQKLGKDSLEELEQQDYIGLIRQLNKYGLRFEEQPEEVEKKLKDFYPVLTDYNREAKTINLAGEEKEVKEIKDIVNDEKGKMNYIIEGDNLHGLKAIEKIYQNSIDLVIIDPPYNTGNEFKYNDKMVGDDDNYRHSKWLSFMDKRLKLARGLMAEEGVIFVHIDDNEQAQLKLLMDDIFGEKNFKAQFDWINSNSIDKDGNLRINGNNNGDFKDGKEYIICYSKNKKFNFSLLTPKKKFLKREITKNGNKKSIINLKKGVEIYSKITNSYTGTVGGKSEPIKILGELKIKNGVIQENVDLEGEFGNRNKWIHQLLYSDEKVYDTKNQKIINIDFNSKGALKIIKENNGDLPTNIIHNVGNVQNSSKKLTEMGLDFDYPKPLDLIKYILKLHSNKNITVLDFFAGSGTTGNAILELNKEDGGNRNFILMTNNENTSLNKKHIIWDYLVENNVVEDYDKTKFTSTGKRYHYYKKYINKNFPLNIDKHYNIETKKEHQENKKLQKFIKTDKFKTFLKNLKLYISDNGICQNVTYPRMKKVIEGYTDSKGNEVEGLGGNLSYLKTDFVPKYKELDKRELALSNKIYNLIKMSEEAHIEIDVKQDFYKLYKSEVEEKKIVAFYNRSLNYKQLRIIRDKINQFEDYKKIIYIREKVNSLNDKFIEELREQGFEFEEIPKELMYL